MAAYTYDNLLHDLKENVIEINVRVHSPTGQELPPRVVRVTLAPPLLPPDANFNEIVNKHVELKGHGTIVAWAVEMRSWFMFVVGDVQYAQVIPDYL